MTMSQRFNHCLQLAEGRSIFTGFAVSKRFVLVVDDEQAVADTLRMVLEHHGFEARSIYSAEAALKFLESSTPDIVLSDVFMPGLNGVELAKAIRSKYPSCKVILMSGNSGTLALMSTSPEERVLAKPFHPSELVKRLEQIEEGETPEMR